MASELAETRERIRADVRAAVKAGALPPYPDGITFRVGAVAGVLATEIQIWACGVPMEWAPPARAAAASGGDPFRVRSRGWLDLEAALLGVVARHYQADGLRSFATVRISYTAPGKQAEADAMIRSWGISDTAGNPVEAGDLVQYHGSVTDAHGEWTYSGDCTCDHCCDYRPGDDEPLPFRRVDLIRRAPGGLQVMRHVNPDNFTGERGTGSSASHSAGNPRPARRPPQAGQDRNRNPRLPENSRANSTHAV